MSIHAVPSDHRVFVLLALVLVGALGWVGRRSPRSRLAELSASAAALGYGSHLVMDWLTRSGVP
ncbi:MAG: hypothetical protein V5A38_13285 [Halolamina sp.]|uniref:hypothetical protein n=1 Tax=Halolamina sp. TaxID=1940283 RepID=UPI002FC2E074